MNTLHGIGVIHQPGAVYIHAPDLILEQGVAMLLPKKYHWVGPIMAGILAIVGIATLVMAVR